MVSGNDGMGPGNEDLGMRTRNGAWERGLGMGPGNEA